MTSRNPKLFFAPVTLQHDTGPGHPERPGRLEAIGTHLDDHFPEMVLESAPPATRDELASVHAADYIDSVFDLRDHSGHLDPDTVISPRSIDAALSAAGMAQAAAEAAIARQDSAFALIRPPGHHAEQDRGMGFCIFNNVAIAAEKALLSPKIERVLIVDWDVHHGNGTQQAFYDRGDVLFFSTHQFPFYPGTGDVDEIGSGDGTDKTVNIPLPAGSGDPALLEAFQSILIPTATDFAPDLVMVSAGFDAHCLDPIGGMQATTDGFGALTAIVDRLADRLADGRLAMILEGGYHLDALARTVGRCIKTLQSPVAKQPDRPSDAPTESALRALERAQKIHG